MTEDEEIEKKVKDYYKNYNFEKDKNGYDKSVYQDVMTAYRDGYKDGLAEGKKELEQWKQEWQDAQIKANEEGFARTTLQIKYSELEKENARLSKMINEAIDFIEQEDMQCKLCSFYLSCRDEDCAYKDEIPTSDIIRAELEKRMEK